MKKERMPFIRTVAEMLLFATVLGSTVSAHAENPSPAPDHVWALGVESHHPVGVAWDNSVRAGILSSIQIYLCFGTQHPFELKLPVVVLGLLMSGVLVALALGLSRQFKQPDTPQS